MKIKMLTLAAGPDGVKHPGTIYDVDAKEGKALIEGRYAEAVAEAVDTAAEAVDTAADQEQPEDEEKPKRGK